MELMRQEPVVINADDPTATLLQMVQASIQGGLTKENVDVTEKLLALFERMDAKKAEKAFNEALTAVQTECRAVGIEAVREVKNKDGSSRYFYASKGDILKVAGPILDRHGFSVSFDVEYDGPRCFAICEFRHKAGHKEKKRYGVRPGSGPPGSNEPQADGSGITYAQRGALTGWLNLTIGKDADENDARQVGDTIPAEKAMELQKRLRACGADEAGFLKFAGAGAVADTATAEEVFMAYLRIPASRLPELEKALAKKERTK
jgi:hypothetical protein